MNEISNYIMQFNAEDLSAEDESRWDKIVDTMLLAGEL